MVCETPERESLEFTLREHYGQGSVQQKREAYSWR
jgi:hypothetical protein